jgi:hypothetical protein
VTGRAGPWRGWIPVFCLCLVAGGCSLRIGPEAPREFSVLAVGTSGEGGARTGGGWIRELDADVILVASPDPGGDPPGERILRPGPGTDPGVRDRLPPLRPPPPLLPPVLEEGDAKVGDAPLYLLTAWIPPTDDDGIQQAAREILGRIADRAPMDALVVVAVGLGDPRLGDGLDRLVGGYLQGWDRCPGGPSGGTPGVPAAVRPSMTLRVYYAPVARLRCVAVQVLESGPGVLLRLRTRP